MAAPTSWADEAAIQAFMLRQLGTVADALAWGISNLIDAADDLLLDMGYSEASEIPEAQMRESRALARVYAWKAAVAALAGLHDYSADNERYNLSQLQEQANNAYIQAQTDAMEFDPDYGVSTIAVIHKDDPYTVLPDETRSIDQ